MKYYIGLDAHSTTSTFAVVDENGQCVLRETVKTSEQSLVQMIGLGVLFIRKLQSKNKIQK